MSRTFHPRRKRRADDGRFLPKDAAMWRRLIVKARAAARHPKANADGLGQAASRCAKAVPPPGYAHRDSCFLRLTVKAALVWSTRGEARTAAAAELQALADQCEGALDAALDRAADRAAGGERRSRERKDIDG